MSGILSLDDSFGIETICTILRNTYGVEINNIFNKQCSNIVIVKVFVEQDMLIVWEDGIIYFTFFDRKVSDFKKIFGTKKSAEIFQKNDCNGRLQVSCEIEAFLRTIHPIPISVSL